MHILKYWVKTKINSKCLLKSKTLCNILIEVSAHLTLNSPKCVIRARDLEGIAEKEVYEYLSSQGVSSVKWLKVCWNNELVL